MFIHNLKYAFKTMFRNKVTLIWTLIFPMALATFMYFAMEKIFDGEIFVAVPVAVVEEVENEAFEETLKELSKEGEEQLLDVSYMAEEEAKVALEAEDVAGIIYVRDEITLTVKESSYTSTMLETVIEEYRKMETVITDVVAEHPEKLQETVETLTSNNVYFTEATTKGASQNPAVNYIYAVFSMSCLFASYGAIEKIGKLQGNISALGMRRCLSPNSKAVTIAAEFVSMLVVQFAFEVITLLYLTALGVDFGNNYLQIMVILFFGVAVGISIGVIIGSISKLSENAKASIATCIGLGLSVLSDLMVGGIKNWVEHTLPILNRINPAVLIADSFYALNVYDTYDKYISNMCILGGITLVLLIISVAMLRRNKYASL